MLHILRKNLPTCLFYFPLSVLGFLIILSSISCDCKNDKRQQTAKGDKTAPLPHQKLGNLDMKVLPANLVGDTKLTVAIFTLEGPGKVLLKDYRLKVTYVNGSGYLEYPMYPEDDTLIQKETNTVNETLAHLSTLSELTPGAQPIKVPFTLRPNLACKQVAIKFELLDQTGKVVKEGSVTWEKGVSVVLKDIQYDKHTRHLTYTVENDGTEPIEDLQLKYINKTPNLYLGSYYFKELDTEKVTNVIDHLGPGQKLEKQDLGELDFNGNLSAEFDFTLIYQGGATTSKSCVFAKDNLGLILNYDPIKSEVSYTITNKNNTEAKDVKLQYKNASLHASKKSVTLGGHIHGITAAVDLAPKTGQTTGTFSIDFKAEDDVIFEFTVLCQGAMIVRKLEQFHAPKVDLELKLESSPRLEGEEREVRLRIVSKSNSRPLEQTDLAKLSLVRAGLVHDHLFSKDVDGLDKMGAQLKFDNLDAIKNPIRLYLDVNELKKQKETSKEFIFELHYQYEQQGGLVKVDWKLDADLSIEPEEAAFVEVGRFCLRGPNSDDLDITNLTVEIKPADDSKASFVLLDSNDQAIIEKEAPFSRLVGENILRGVSKNAKFKLIDAQGEKAGKVNILLKRGAHLIHVATMNWEEPVYNLLFYMHPDTGIFDDQAGINIELVNWGHQLDTDNIKLELINDLGITFQLGKAFGAPINANLTQVLGVKNTWLKKETKCYIKLERNPTHPLPKAYKVNMLFKLETTVDRGQNFSAQRELTWINTTKIEEEIKQALEDRLREAQKDFEAAKKKMGNFTYAPQSEDMEKIYNARKRAIQLKEKAEKKLEDEKDLLYDDLKERIQIRTIQPAEKLISDIDAYYATFLFNYVGWEKTLAFRRTL